MIPEPYFWHADQLRLLTERAAAAKLSHAILVRGAKGLGKTEFARRFANWLLCKESSRPCGECSACQQYRVGTHPDYFDVAPLEDKKIISVDQVRELTLALHQTASKGGWQVAVIHPADAMNINAANSLLKTLEEPSAGSVLILVTSNPARLPATIRSRCTQLAISAPPMEQAVMWLGHSDQEEAQIVLAYCAGAPLEAKRLLDTDFLASRQTYIQQIVQVVSGKLDPIVAADSWREQPEQALKWLLGWTQDLVRIKQIPEKTNQLANPDCIKDLQTVAERIHLISLHNYLKALGEGHRLLNTTANMQLLMESFLIPWAFNLDPMTIEQLA